MSSQPSPQVNPEHIFFTLNAFQQSYALKGAIELELFTHIAGGEPPATIGGVSGTITRNDKIFPP